MYKFQILENAKKVYVESGKKVAAIATDYNMSAKDYRTMCTVLTEGAAAQMIIEAFDNEHDLNNLLYFFGKLNIGRTFIPADAPYKHDKSKAIAAAHGELDRNFDHYDAATTEKRAPLYYALNAVLEDESGNMFKLFWKNHPESHDTIVEMLGLHYCDILILH